MGKICHLVRHRDPFIQKFRKKVRLDLRTCSSMTHFKSFNLQRLDQQFSYKRAYSELVNFMQALVALGSISICCFQGTSLRSSPEAISSKGGLERVAEIEHTVVYMPCKLPPLLVFIFIYIFFFSCQVTELPLNLDILVAHAAFVRKVVTICVQT